MALGKGFIRVVFGSAFLFISSAVAQDLATIDPIKQDATAIGETCPVQVGDGPAAQQKSCGLGFCWAHDYSQTYRGDVTSDTCFACDGESPEKRKASEEILKKLNIKTSDVCGSFNCSNCKAEGLLRPGDCGNNGVHKEACPGNKTLCRYHFTGPCEIRASDCSCDSSAAPAEY